MNRKTKGALMELLQKIAWMLSEVVSLYERFEKFALLWSQLNSFASEFFCNFRISSLLPGTIYFFNTFIKHACITTI